MKRGRRVARTERAKWKAQRRERQKNRRPTALPPPGLAQRRPADAPAGGAQGGNAPHQPQGEFENAIAVRTSVRPTRPAGSTQFPTRRRLPASVWHAKTP
jgi:hypothetical protein